MLSLGSLKTTRASLATRCVIALTFLVASSGCSMWNSKRDSLPEYDKAKNAIEGYEDSDGNWVRPEGRRADKKKGTATSAISKYVPGLAEKPINKVKAKALLLEADAAFEEARRANEDEQASKFRKAAKIYVDASKHWTQSAFEQDALMMAGECYFFAEEYPKAEQQYARLLKEYPRTRYLDQIDARRMEIAMYWMKFNQVEPKPFYMINFTDKKFPWSDTGGHGRRVIEDIRLSNPTGKLSDDGTMELALNAFAKGKYQEAADEFEVLRLTYPDSPHQFDAHFIGLKAVLETYNGPEHNGEALIEAEKLIKQTERLFPQQSKDQGEYLTRAKREIRYKKAERLWSQAEYRMNKQENASAKYYIEQILSDPEYADTPFAEDCKAALEKLRDKPDNPPQRLKWFIDLFPKNDPINPLINK